MHTIILHRSLPGRARARESTRRPALFTAGGRSGVAQDLFQSLVRHPVQSLRGRGWLLVWLQVPVVEEVLHGVVVLGLVGIDARYLGRLEWHHLAGGLAVELFPGRVQESYGDFVRHYHVLARGPSHPSRLSLSHVVRNLFAAVLAGTSPSQSSSTCL